MNLTILKVFHKAPKITLALFLFVLCAFSLSAQCGDIAKAETYWNKNEFTNAIDELLRVKRCPNVTNERIAEATKKISDYCQKMEKAKRALDIEERKLTIANDSLKAQKKRADDNFRKAEESRQLLTIATEKAQTSEKQASSAKRNFYQGLVILFKYISLTGHTRNFTEWAASEKQTDSLREVLNLMVDNSPLIEAKGLSEKEKWKQAIIQMNPDQMANLFSILAGEKKIIEPTGGGWDGIRALMAENEAGLALAELRTLEKQEKSPDVYQHMAECCLQLEKPDSAEYYAAEAYRLRPNTVQGLVTLRRVHSKLHHFREAEYYAKRVIEAKKTEAQPVAVTDYSNLSYYQIFTGDYQGALASADSALTIEPRNWVKVNKAHALLFLNRKEEALKLYKELGPLSNDSPSGSGILRTAIRADLNEIEAAGLKRSEFDEIRRF